MHGKIGKGMPYLKQRRESMHHAPCTMHPQQQYCITPSWCNEWHGNAYFLACLNIEAHILPVRTQFDGCDGWACLVDGITCIAAFSQIQRTSSTVATRCIKVGVFKCWEIAAFPPQTCENKRMQMGMSPMGTQAPSSPILCFHYYFFYLHILPIWSIHSCLCSTIIVCWGLSLCMHPVWTFPFQTYYFDDGHEGWFSWDWWITFWENVESFHATPLWFTKVPRFWSLLSPLSASIMLVVSYFRSE